MTTPKQHFIKGAFILTLTGGFSRLIGFFYRIFLSQTFGEEGMGLYQLIFPIYALCFSLSVSAIETTISRSVSSKLALGKEREAKEFFFLGLLISFSLGIFSMLFLQQNYDFISTQILHEPQAAPFITLMSYALPLSAIHGCIVGYYYGRKQTLIPAVAQLIEQLTRVASIYFIYQYCAANAISMDSSIAVLGLVIGEFASSFFCIIAIKKQYSSRYQGRFHSFFLSIPKHLPALCKTATPLTISRVSMNVLHSIEAISIPLQLQIFGYTTKEALSLYGVLTGMALPCILFPTAITSSVSILLLPTVAEIQARESQKEIKQLVRKTILYSTALGLFCLITFFSLSNFVGNTLFHSQQAAIFIKILAWLCPFLYINITITSVINGLGKTTLTFFINSVSLILRIVCIFSLIPTVGIYGYLFGLLVSQIITTLLCVITLKKSALI